jgi:hypothetical protein
LHFRAISWAIAHSFGVPEWFTRSTLCNSFFSLLTFQSILG